LTSPQTTSYQVRVDIGSAGSSAGEPTDDDAGEAPSLSAKAKGKRRARDSSEDSMISKFTVDSEAAAEEEEESDDDDAAEEDADDSADSIVPEEPDPSGESDAGAGTVQLIRATLAERKGRGPQAAPASKGKAHKGQASHAGTPGVFDFRTPTYAQATGATYTLSPTSRLPGAFDDAEANFGYGKPLIQQDGVSPETRVALLKQWVPIPFGLDWPYVEDLGYWPKLPGITPIERERPPLTLLTSECVRGSILAGRGLLQAAPSRHTYRASCILRSLRTSPISTSTIRPRPIRWTSTPTARAPHRITTVPRRRRTTAPRSVS
jgi:hypothetical protein